MAPGNLARTPRAWSPSVFSQPGTLLFPSSPNSDRRPWQLSGPHCFKPLVPSPSFQGILLLVLPDPAADITMVLSRRRAARQSSRARTSWPFICLPIPAPFLLGPHSQLGLLPGWELEAERRWGWKHTGCPLSCPGYSACRGLEGWAAEAGGTRGSGNFLLQVYPS